MNVHIPDAYDSTGKNYGQSFDPTIEREKILEKIVSEEENKATIETGKGIIEKLQTEFPDVYETKTVPGMPEEILVGTYIHERSDGFRLIVVATPFGPIVVDLNANHSEISESDLGQLVSYHAEKVITNQGETNPAILYLEAPTGPVLQFTPVSWDTLGNNSSTSVSTIDAIAEYNRSMPIPLTDEQRAKERDTLMELMR